MPTKRECHQVVLRLLPGGEPWYRVECSSGKAFAVPGTMSLQQVWERIRSGTSGSHTPEGELMVMVSVNDVLTLGGVRELRRRRRDQAD